MFCVNCGHPMEKGWNLCPKCGAKAYTAMPPFAEQNYSEPAPFKRNWYWWLKLLVIFAIMYVFYQFLMSYGAHEKQQTNPQNTQAVSVGVPEQTLFLRTMEQFNEKYQKADNEIKQSAIYRDQISFLKNYLGTGEVSQWEGKIESIETTKGGDFASVSIKNRHISFVTPYSIIGDRESMIKIGSAVYKQLESLKVGDPVIFSGNFVPDDQTGFKERSVREKGFVNSPEFVFRFRSISRFGNESISLPEQKWHAGIIRHKAVASHLNQYVSLNSVVREFREKYGSGSSIGDYIVINLLLQNNASKNITGIKGIASCKNKAGVELYSFEVKNNRVIPAGQSHPIHKFIKFDSSNDIHHKIKNTKVTDLEIEWTLQEIIFEDGQKAVL